MINVHCALFGVGYISCEYLQQRESLYLNRLCGLFSTCKKVITFPWLPWIRRQGSSSSDLVHADTPHDDVEEHDIQDHPIPSTPNKLTSPVIQNVGY